MSDERDVSYATTAYVRDHCVCLHVQRAARALARRFDVALRPLGLTNGQFSLLMALNRPEPAAMGSLASLLGMDRTTLTAAVKPLERRGLAATSASGTDRRSRLIGLTEEGRRVLARAFPIWREAHAEIDRLPGAGDELRAALKSLA